MVTSYQKDVWGLLPEVFSRKQLLQIGTDLNLNISSVASYIHSWTHRNMITKDGKGNYVKLTKDFIEPKKGCTARCVSKIEEEKAIKADNDYITRYFGVDATTNEAVEKSAEEDVVLKDFNVKAATDEELLTELVSRGYSWEVMRRTVVTNIPFADFANCR